MYIACQEKDGKSKHGAIRLGTSAEIPSKCLNKLLYLTDSQAVVFSFILGGSEFSQ